MNFAVHTLHTDVLLRQVPSRSVVLYAAGPPCQGIATCGKRGYWSDPRSRPYLQAIFAIEENKPVLFLLENSHNLSTIDEDRLVQHIVARLRNAGYEVYTSILNVLDLGLPRNRSRLLIVGNRIGSQRSAFQWPCYIEPIRLTDLLIPRPHDPAQPTLRPASATAAETVELAIAAAKAAATTGEWIVADHLSRQYMPHPRPSPHCPGMTSGKRNGHWIGSRGRRLTYRECARIQGYPADALKWHARRNTIAKPMAQRVIVALMRAIGIQVTDPWLTGEAQRALVAEAQLDRLPPQALHLIRQRLIGQQCVKATTCTLDRFFRAPVQAQAPTQLPSATEPATHEAAVQLSPMDTEPQELHAPMEEDPTTPAHIEVVTPPARDIAQASGPSRTATRAPGMKRRGRDVADDYEESGAKEASGPPRPTGTCRTATGAQQCNSRADTTAGHHCNTSTTQTDAVRFFRH